MDSRQQYFLLLATRTSNQNTNISIAKNQLTSSDSQVGTQQTLSLTKWRFKLHFGGEKEKKKKKKGIFIKLLKALCL